MLKLGQSAVPIKPNTPAWIRTRVARFKVWSANHYTTGALPLLLPPLPISMGWYGPRLAPKQEPRAAWLRRDVRMLVECILLSGAGGRRSDTPASWRDSGGTEWVGSIGFQGWMALCRCSAQVTLVCPLEARRRPWPTWGLRKAEPGQAGDGAAQMPRNREFLDCRAEQWPPTCRWAYLDCAAHFSNQKDRHRLVVPEIA